MIISSHSMAGNLNTPITYVGIACATNLIKTSFTPDDMNLSTQLVNLLANHSFVVLNRSLLSLFP
jgi:hypothetical protein